MKKLYDAARALYGEAFPGEPPAFTDALFALGFPDHFVSVCEDGELVSMLFALPYPVLTENGPIQARYLYAVATAKAKRGQGHAKRLLQRLGSEGTPIFLRPMSPSLFDFYKSAGFSPFSPHRELCGNAEGQLSSVSDLTPAQYLTARDRFLTPPYCRMSEEFLSLSFSLGGAIGKEGEFAALYERDGDTVLFKEWWGDPEAIPAAAAHLGAKRFEARLPDPNGTPFGMGMHVPDGTAFLAALD